MSLREQASVDNAIIVEDPDGFGWPITVTSPEGVSAALMGLSSDVSLVIDPETGQAVSGRTASVALRVASLTAAGLAMPTNVPESSSYPWLVVFDDINGNSHTFKVSSSRPDRAFGLVVCLLEAYG
jgi:hypothetical protein